MTLSQEQTPVSQPEQQQAIPPTKTVAEQIQDFVQKNSARFAALEQEFEQNQSIQSKQGIRDRETLTRSTRDILFVIQNHKADATMLRKLPPLTVQILTSMKPSAMSEKNSPLLYCLLKHSQTQGQLESANRITDAVREIHELRHLDPDTAKSVLTPLLVKLAEKGVEKDSSPEIKAVYEFIDPTQATEPATEHQKDRELSNKYNSTYEGAMAQISGIGLSAEKRQLIELEVRTQHADGIRNGNVTNETIQALIKDKNMQEQKILQNTIRDAFYDVQSYAHRDNMTQAQAEMKYLSVLASLQSQGDISESTKQGLEASLTNLRPWIESVQNHRMGSSELIETARRTIPQLTHKQEQILGAMSDVDALERLILNEVNPLTREKLYLDNHGEINWNVFYEDVNDIFEEILSVADARPDQFFQEAFSPMYEGHLYDLLLKSLSGLGKQLAAKPNSKLFNKMVKYNETAVDPNPGETNVIGSSRTELPREKGVTVSFSDALGNHLKNDMITLLHLRESLHNIDAICTMGLGWEQLSQYADRINSKSIDWIFRKDKDMGNAYQQYIKSLESTVSSNGRVITATFGQHDTTLHLDATASNAYYKLYSQLKKDHSDWNDDTLKTKTIQKIRTAEAIAKGVTGEFWTKLLAARMPIGQTTTTDVDGRTIFKVDLPFIGAGDAGYEKMIGQLDLDLMLERFGLPRFYNSMRYVWRQRDIEHGAAKDPYSSVEEWNKRYQHGDVYKWAKADQDAFFRGRNDDLAAFDEESIFLYDSLKTNNIGMFARGGWRFIDHKALFIYKPGETGKDTEPDYAKIDHIKTLKNLQRTGVYLVKNYIDDLVKGDAFTKLSASEMQTLCGINKTFASMTIHEKKHLGKEELYARLVFGHYAAVSPTKMAKLEMRRWTPLRENMIKDDLVDYMRGEYSKMGIKYDDGLLFGPTYKMYMTAMELVESSVWNNEKEIDWAKIPPYQFGVKHIEEHEAELKTFYKQYRDVEFGVYERGQGEIIRLFETEEQFLQMIKGMTVRLRSSIEKERWNREDHGRKDAKKQTLEERFAHYLNKDMAGIKGFVAGDDFDFSKFYMHASGRRMGGRHMGETFLCTSKMNPALGKLLMEVIPTLIKEQYEDIHAFEKALKQHMLPPFKDIFHAIEMIDKGQADGYVVELMVFMGNLLGKDREFRMKGVGPVYDWWWRRMFPTSQANIMQDFFRNNYNRPTTALDSDQLYAMGHVVLNELNVSANEEIPHHYEDVRLFGVKFGEKRINEGEKLVPYKIKILGKEITIPGLKRKIIEHSDFHKHTIEDYEKAIGLTGKARWIENYIPIAIIIAFLVAAGLMKLAADKNKKK